MKIALFVLTLLKIYAIVQSTRFQKMKKQENSKPEPAVKLNTEHLPTLSEILNEINISHRLQNLVKMGITETRHLLRMKRMDYNMMVIKFFRLKKLLK